MAERISTINKINYLDHADLPKLRASGTDAQLDIAAVFAVRKSKSTLPGLF
jgi:imidazolonepropionase-like amidohydrolase